MGWGLTCIYEWTPQRRARGYHNDFRDSPREERREQKKAQRQARKKSR